MELATQESTLEGIKNFDGNGKKALIFWGGWDGHEPDLIARRIRGILENYGMEVAVYDNQDCLSDETALFGLHLIVPIWTMGEIDDETVNRLSKVIGNGTGIAGCHGGMCDAFRQSVQWQFITGGNWVSHPGGDGIEYEVSISDRDHPLIEGIANFKVSSEQYYLHVDPAVKVHATTRFPSAHWYHSSNGPVDVPVIWTKYWGHGRVFYTALGHHNDVFDIPEAGETLERGLIWAAMGKDIALAANGTFKDYESEEKMF